MIGRPMIDTAGPPPGRRHTRIHISPVYTARVAQLCRCVPMRSACPDRACGRRPRSSSRAATSRERAAHSVCFCQAHRATPRAIRLRPAPAPAPAPPHVAAPRPPRPACACARPRGAPQRCGPFHERGRPSPIPLCSAGSAGAAHSVPLSQMRARCLASGPNGGTPLYIPVRPVPPLSCCHCEPRTICT